MGLVRLGLILKPAAVDAHVAGLAPVHPRQGRVEVPMIKLVEDRLLNSRDAWDSKAVDGNQHIRVEPLLDTISRRSQLLHLIFPLLALKLEFVKLFLNLIPLCLSSAELRIQSGGFGLAC